eukprot:GHVS01099869.1.p1 GENE.GHVS01099869.1~~GHVS01099869.1.p1  ORF type:complete len:121 (+),score=5.60 GHVS01099869.1:203-565(+)
MFIRKIIDMLFVHRPVVFEDRSICRVPRSLCLYVFIWCLGHIGTVFEQTHVVSLHVDVVFVLYAYIEVVNEDMAYVGSSHMERRNVYLHIYDLSLVIEVWRMKMYMWFRRCRFKLLRYCH